jgi:hypothetical protein
MLAVAGVAPGDTLWVDERAATMGGTVARLILALGSLAGLLLLRRKILAAMTVAA